MLWSSQRQLEGDNARVGGTGSISCRSITDGDADEAAQRRGPLGFVVPAHESEYVAAVEELLDALGVPEVVLPRPAWGEADWTARDLHA